MRYDHESGEHEVVSDAALGGEAPDTVGVCAPLGASFLAYYNLEGRLFLRVDELCLEFDRGIGVTVGGEPHDPHADAARRWICVERDGQELVRLDYLVDLTAVFPDDPTPFIEMDHFDFGLSLANFAASESRKRVLLGLE